MAILEVNDFSGGKTDKFIDARKNKFQDAINFLISTNNKLNTRPGLIFFTATADDTRIPILAGNVDIGTIFQLDDIGFFQSVNNVFFGDGSSAFVNLTGPTGNAALQGSISGPTNLTADTRVTHAFWNKHIILANDAYERPRKIYKDENAVFQVRTAGLIPFSISAELAFTLDVSTSIGSPTLTVVGFDQDADDVNVGDYVNGLSGFASEQRVIDVPSSTTITLDASATGAASSDTATFSSLTVAPPSNTLARTGDTTDGSFSITSIVPNTTGLAIGDTVSGAGIPSDTIIANVVSSTEITISKQATATAAGVALTFGGKQIYTYTFYYSYIYFIGTEQFEDLGPTIVVQQTGLFPPDTIGIEIARLPELGNGKNGWPLPYSQIHENFDPDNVKIRIHRSLSSQSTLFELRQVPNGINRQTGDITSGLATLTSLTKTEGLLVGDIVAGTGIPAGTTILTVDSATALTMSANATATTVGLAVDFTLVDSQSDDDIDDNLVVYTDTGVYDNDQPPPCKYVHTVNDITWYGHVKEGDQIFTSRVKQSIKFDIDSVPASFLIDLEDEVTGIGSVQIYPIIGCKNTMFRLEGVHDELGRGFIDKREISRATGLISHNSIVNTIDGMFFAGNDGFYFTDAYRIVKISDEINESYQALVQSLDSKKNIYGFYFEKEQQIWWTCQQDAASPDNDVIFVLHLRYGVKRDAVFTTLEGGSNFAPTALMLLNSSIVMSDRRGYVFKFDDGTFDDPKIDTTITPSLWERKAIIYDYKGPALDFGTTGVRKWVSTIIFNAENVTNVSVGVFSNNDNSGQFRELKEIRTDDNITWSQPGIIWNGTETNYFWNNTSLVDQQRRFPSRGLRCAYKQMRFTNSFTNITNSDSLGVADVDGAANTVTATGDDWPSDSVDYFITFEADDYTREFQILTRTATVLTVSDTADALPTSSSAKWIIRGFRKSDGLFLTSYALQYKLMTSTQTFFKADIGANT